MKTYRTMALIFGLAAIASPFHVMAATPINQTRSLNPDGEIKVENISGLIKVRVWNEPRVQITGSLGEGVEKLIVEGDAKSLHIQVKYPDRKAGSTGAGAST